jgi:hypothetical protein
MADSTIDIGFNVANGDLKDGLDKAVQDFETTSAAITQDLASISQSAKTTGNVLVTFADAESRQDATAATRRKAAAEGFAQEASDIEILKTLNQISADQAIADQLQIENAKFKRLSDELQAEAQADNATLEMRKQLQNQLDAVESQHFAKVRQLNQEAVAETMRSWQEMLTPISNAFSSSLSGMITGQENFRQALARIGDSIVSDFVNMAVKRATNWIAGELTMTSASTAGDAARTASHDAAIVEGQAASAAAGSASVFGDANKAAAGAFSAVAEIPIVGPILAPAAAVAAFAAVMAYDVFSAEGGFDIPAGLNPVTQLHEREMVLPASIAEPLRNNLSGGRGGSGGGDIHIHAVDAASFQRLLSNNKSALAKTLRAAQRGFDPALT